MIIGRNKTLQHNFSHVEQLRSNNTLKLGQLDFYLLFIKCRASFFLDIPRQVCIYNSCYNDKNAVTNIAQVGQFFILFFIH